MTSLHVLNVAKSGDSLAVTNPHKNPVCSPDK